MNAEIKVLPKWVINLFLYIGLTAAICIRSLALLNSYNPEWGHWVWRFAMICYVFFFGYRYFITRRRRTVVVNKELIRQVEESCCIEDETKTALLYILKSIVRSKELFNYSFISLLSLCALILDLILS